jgi:polysaccharide deacetylase 2 family uncharacterized protein YibQ
MTGLLVAISVLLVMVILLIPDGSGDTTAPVADTSNGEMRDTATGDTDSVAPQSEYSVEQPPAATSDENGVESSGTVESEEEPRPWWLPEPVPGVPPGTVYIVLDDAGGSLQELERFLDVGFPLTIAVLPRLAYSSESALAAVTAGHEVILHQPMEAIGGGDPGPGAILVGTPVNTIESLVRENLATVPGAIGVNNHMGSRATQDPVIMTALLHTLQNDGLLFLDSRTSPDTVGASIARDTNILFAERHVFLDNEREVEPILAAFRSGFLRAGEGYDTIMIGHVTSDVLASLIGEVGDRAQEAGFRFGYLSDAVERYDRVAEGQRR